MSKDEVLKLALEALEWNLPVIEDWGGEGAVNLQHKAIAAIYEALAQPEQEPWPDEPAGHMAGGVQPSKMTKSKAITAIYALFNAPHNADINLTGLNKVLDELMAQPEQEPVALEDVYLTIIQWDVGGGKRSRRELARRIVAKYTTPPQRKPLTDVTIWNTYKNLWMFHPAEEPRLAGDVLKFARAIEQAHGIKE